MSLPVPPVRYLQYWLLTAAGLRVLSVVLGFRDPSYFRKYLFSKKPKEVSALYGRTFGTWTSVTCALCVLCARNIDSAPIYQATMFSFVAALAHFGTELFLYGTMSPRNALSPAVVATVSAVWMAAGYSTYVDA